MQEETQDERFEYKSDLVDIQRMFGVAGRSVSREFKLARLFFIANMIPWIAFGVAIGTLFNLYESHAVSRRHLTVVAFATVIGLIALVLSAHYKKHKWISSFSEGARWLAQGQWVLLSDDRIFIESSNYKFEYDWSVFTNFHEDRIGIIVGGGAEPILFVPKDGRVSTARLDWIRERFK